MFKFKSLVNSNYDPVLGRLTIDLELLTSKPHDLRPQDVTWSTIRTVGQTESGQPIIEKVPNSIYTTIGARLAGAVGKSRSMNDQIDNIIASLAEDGIEIKQSCKL